MLVFASFDGQSKWHIPYLIGLCSVYRNAFSTRFLGLREPCNSHCDVDVMRKSRNMDAALRSRSSVHMYSNAIFWLRNPGPQRRKL